MANLVPIGNKDVQFASSILRQRLAVIITSVEQESMQSLLLKMQFNGQLLSTGTGFIVRTPIGPVLVTNRHNVTGRDQNTGQPLSRTGAIPNETLEQMKDSKHTAVGSNALKDYLMPMKNHYGKNILDCENERISWHCR